jgi:acyl transferase domain-containing protein
VTRDADTALLFPGQGSHEAGMRAAVEAARPDLVELALEVVGDDPFARAADSTRFAQPAIFCASVAALPAELDDSIGWTAGHSLGEFAALVAAGSIGAKDGLRLVALRGRLMDEAAGGAGGMLAVVGPDAEEKAAELAFETGTYVANHNSPSQVVLAGREGAITEAHRIARSRSVRAMVLPVRGAFHSPLMESTREPFAAALADVEVTAPRVTVLSGVTAAPFDDIRAGLVDAMTQPVRWRQLLEALSELGARRFVEAPPGKVLTGLVRKTLTGAEASTWRELADA